MIRPLIFAVFLASPAFAGGMAYPIVQGEIIRAKPRPAWMDTVDKGRDTPEVRPVPETPPEEPGCTVDCGPVDPPADPDVCDGGARSCRDGERPTGTVSDPTKYLEERP